MRNEMQEDKKLTICRLIFEFAPMIGGSITHTIELSEHINPYCKRQFLIAPKADVDTTQLDKNSKSFIFPAMHIGIKISSIFTPRRNPC